MALPFLFLSGKLFCSLRRARTDSMINIFSSPFFAIFSIRFAMPLPKILTKLIPEHEVILDKRLSRTQQLDWVDTAHLKLSNGFALHFCRLSIHSTCCCFDVLMVDTTRNSELVRKLCGASQQPWNSFSPPVATSFNIIRSAQGREHSSASPISTAAHTHTASRHPSGSDEFK